MDNLQNIKVYSDSLSSQELLSSASQYKIDIDTFHCLLRVQNAGIGLKINVRKTKSLRLGISEDEKVILGDENIVQVDSFT